MSVKGVSERSYPTIVKGDGLRDWEPGAWQFGSGRDVRPVWMSLDEEERGSKPLARRVPAGLVGARESAWGGKDLRWRGVEDRR